MRALAARARRGHPRPQLPAARDPGRRRLRRRLARPVAPGGGLGGLGDRVLRRALHGRDGVGAVARQDGPDPRRRRRLLARRRDHARPAARLAGPAPGRDHGDVRQHDGRDQGADRLLRDVGQRGLGRRAHPARARAGHGDPVRAGHVPRRLRRAPDRPRAARLGRRVPRPRRHPPARHRAGARRAPGRRLPHPSRVRLLDLGHGVRRGRRPRRPTASTCSRPAACCATPSGAQPGPTAIVATEIGMLHPLREAAPDTEFIAANERAACTT